MHWFSTKGWRQFVRICEGLEFDPVFYAEFRPETEALENTERLRYWLCEGLNYDDPGSAPKFLANQGLSLSSFPSAFQWLSYVEERPQAAANRWMALQDFLQWGFEQYSDRFIEGPESIILFLALGLHYSLKNDVLAIQAYELARRRDNLPAPQLQHLADAYLRGRAWRPAADLYRQVLKSPSVNIWTVRNLIQCAAKIGLTSEIVIECLNPRLEYAEADRVEVVLTCANASFSLTKEKVYNLLARQKYLDASWLTRRETATLQKMMADFLCPQGRVVSKAALSRVILVVNNDVSYRSARRIDGKITSLATLGINYEIAIYQNIRDMTGLVGNDVAIIFYQVPALPDVLLFLTLANSAGSTMYFDTDDDIATDRSLPKFCEYFGYLRKSEYNSLCFGNYLYAAMASFCDYGIAPTPQLSKRLAGLTRKKMSFVMRDRVGTNNQEIQSSEGREAQRPFCVSLSSDRFIMLDIMENPICSVIFEILKNKSDVVLQISGPIKIGPEFTSLFCQIKHSEDSIEIPDLAISLFDDSLLGRYQTSIVWAKAAIHRVPLLSCQSSLYDSDMTMEVASSPEEALRLIETYRESSLKRRELGERAYDDFKNFFNTEVELASFRAILEEVI